MTIMETIKRADAIRDRAEADYEVDTARLVRLLTGKSFWQRVAENAKGKL